MTQLIETFEKNNKKFQNIKKFETQCTRHTVEEKSRLVFIWCRKMLKAWDEDLHPGEDGKTSRPPDFMNTSEGKVEQNHFNLCKKNIRPLLKHLKKERLATEILDSLYLIVQYSMMKEYVKAHDKYLQLGIGNSPWPMGVTQVGIHERSGRSRIFTSQVQHVMNDETQRKYLQAFKRLLTICEEHYKAECQ